MTVHGGVPVENVVPEYVYDSMPDELRGSELYGLVECDPDESVLLHGPPGAGKTTEMTAWPAAYRRFVNGDLGPRDMTVVTYRRELSDDMRAKLQDWNVWPDVQFGKQVVEDKESDDEVSFQWPDKYIGTASAVSARAANFFDKKGFREPTEQNTVTEFSGMVERDAMHAFCEKHGIEFSWNPNRDTQWNTFYDLYTYSRKNLLDVGEYDFDTDGVVRPLRSDMIARRKLDEFGSAVGAQSSVDAEQQFRATAALWNDWKAKNFVYEFFEQLEAGLTGSLPGMELVLIDELHDAYPLMSLLFERWIDEAEVAVVAGDPHQVCNSFSGSHPGIFRNLNNRIEKDLPVVQLPRSHRVPDEPYCAAARLLEQHHSPPELETDGPGVLREYRPDEKTRIRGRDTWALMSPDTPGSPLWMYHQYGPELMLLARTQTLCDALGSHLDAAGVVYQSQTGVAGNWEKRLRLMHGIYIVSNTKRDSTRTRLDREIVTDLLMHSPAGLIDLDKSEVRDEVRTYEDDEVTVHEDEIPVAALQGWVDSKFWAVLGQGRDAIGELVRIDSQHGFTGDRGRDVNAMLTAWTRYNDESEFGSGFPENPGGVETKIWTMHASKGDESSNVGVYLGATHRVSESVREYEDQGQNESRTLYVALTRCSETCHVIRDWCDLLVEDYDKVPYDLVPIARRIAADRRDDTDSTGSAAISRGD